MPLKRRSLIDLPAPMVIAFLLLAAMVIISLGLAARLANNASEASRLSEYRRAVTDLMGGARDAEIGQRGYLLTGNRAYLDPYERARNAIPPALDDLRRGDARGPAVVARLRPLIDDKMLELSETILLEATGKHDAALATVRSNFGKQVMDQIRIVGETERQWALRRSREISDDSRSAVRQLTAALIGGVIAIIVLSLVWLYQARRQFAEVDAARGTAETALVALQRETRARAETQDQLRQMQKMESIGQLTGGIAHDFNNMLAVVIGGIELAKRRLTGDPDKAHAQLDNALDGATRAAALTSRLLAFSRRQPLAPVPLDANALVSGMAEMLARTLGDNIQVETVQAAGLWRCYADAGEIENALLNLAVNARDAMPEGGKLTIETANTHIDDRYAESRFEVAPGQYVVMCVTDTGTGMSPDVIEQAFEPFFTTKEVGRGTGLGLSQVFGFVKQSGGHVAIYSEVGEGTTIKLYLPRFLGAVVDAAPAGAPAEMPQGRADEVILVVEDEQRVRHFAGDVLRELGYTVIQAPGPEQALRLIEGETDIALQFTDIVMPVMTGRQLADRAHELRPALKVLYTTGYTRNAVVHNGMVDVGVALLAKPYSIIDLARKVRSVIDGGGINRSV